MDLPDPVGEDHRTTTWDWASTILLLLQDWVSFPTNLSCGSQSRSCVQIGRTVIRSTFHRSARMVVLLSQAILHHLRTLSHRRMLDRRLRTTSLLLDLQLPPTGACHPSTCRTRSSNGIRFLNSRFPRVWQRTILLLRTSIIPRIHTPNLALHSLLQMSQRIRSQRTWLHYPTCPLMLGPHQPAPLTNWSLIRPPRFRRAWLRIRQRTGTTLLLDHRTSRRKFTLQRTWMTYPPLLAPLPLVENTSPSDQPSTYR